MVDSFYHTIIQEWKKRELPPIIDRETNLENYVDMPVNKIIAVTGFRRTGKTYLVLGLIRTLLEKNKREEVVYINFEDERIPATTPFLTGLLPAIKEELSPKYLFMDELQNIPAWSKWLRRIYDTENIRIVVTGSSSKMSSNEIPTELRGRFIEIKILPLSFSEFLQFKKIERRGNESEWNDTILQKALQEFIQYGGMPEVVLAPEVRKKELLHGYFDTVVRRDIIEQNKIENEEVLKTLLKLLLNSTYFTISKTHNNLKSLHLSTGKDVIQKYFRAIENAFLVYSLYYFSYSMKDQLQYPRKIFFVDTGFINELSSSFSQNKGRNYENVVFLELQRRKKETYYWKSRSHQEVDFVIVKREKVEQLIQVCYEMDDYETKKRETNAIIKASNELLCTNLLIITQNKEGEETINGKKIKYVPLWKWLLKKE
jgi:predicted AAA+ superfamily ATPase